MELKYNREGLIPAIIEDQEGRVLMLAYMNQESLEKTLETGLTWFYSRSRKKLWQKGETSGNVQHVISIAADCDYDALLIKVKQEGLGACHEGYKSCFHNQVVKDSDCTSARPVFDPKAVYSVQVLQQIYDIITDRQNNPKEGSYTNYLFHEGIDKILKKVGEEAAEVIIAAKNPEEYELIYEVSDLLYHLLVLLVEKGIKLDEIWQELNARM
ncbi:MAG: bifunctional phosphoribosyl-AMP cyclohydrolase/phosphoribosyl-ATP diphosphatase HisIE [Firmicutes bacterium]|nr:bifunctional phosphoribosyl-AMP cyclohydrolase/phosphoribosyl-ATP diphosphatase HisIE [Bacillota bacterium]